MKLALPVSVKFLHRGNKELSRNLSSYLSLAAINNAELLAPHIQPIIDSIIGGNYSLARVLPQIYAVNKHPIHDHVMALVSLLPQSEEPEKLSLLSLFGLIAKQKPSVRFKFSFDNSKILIRFLYFSCWKAIYRNSVNA